MTRDPNRALCSGAAHRAARAAGERPIGGSRTHAAALLGENTRRRTRSFDPLVIRSATTSPPLPSSITTLHQSRQGTDRAVAKSVVNSSMGGLFVRELGSVRFRL